jgi:ligand-binding SRPBCC domain-containing protein
VNHVLERVQILPRPREEVFAFFADARNLERLTPGFLNFSILTPTPIDIGEGALIDYRIRLFGVPLNWRTRIDVYEPGVRFVDRQLSGPYRTWIHLHEFSDHDGGRATKMLDRVEYEVGFGPFGRIARELIVRRTLERIFDYRAEVMEREMADRTRGEQHSRVRPACDPPAG